MTHTRVAALQMVTGRDVAANLEAAGGLLARAADGGARLAVLPEVFAQIATGEQVALGRQEAGADAVVRPWLAERARRHNLWIVAGSLPLADSPTADRVAAACLVYDPAGNEVARYDKIHLFDVDVADSHGSYRESATFRPGSEPVTVTTPLGELGLSVCYDLRFAELYRALAQQGAQILTVPAAFTRHTGLAHWLPLARARAIENQCYLVGANQGGQHSRRRFTSGGSVIIDPWGRVLTEAGFGEDCLIAEIDLDMLADIRRKMPVAQHRRL